MTTAIQVLGGLLIAGGFLWMMWGLILILKEAYKVSVLWLVGCMAMPIVMAFFVIKYPERVQAPRMVMLKGLIPLVLGIVLLVWLAPPSGKTAVKPEVKAPPAPVAVAAPAPAPKLVAAAPQAVAPAPVAEEPAPAAIDHGAPDPAILSGCRNEIGLYCDSVKHDAHALKECLSDYRDNLMAGCKTVLREKNL